MSNHSSVYLENGIGILGDLIGMNTESHRSNLEIIDYFEDIFRKNKIKYFINHNRDKTKANIFATLPDSEGSEEGGLLLSGHSDVVPVAGQVWTDDPYRMTSRDEKLYGRGTCDMKGFIAGCLAVLPHYLHSRREKPIHFSFSYDEEIGCLGAKVLVEELKAKGVKPELAIIGEPTEMKVIEGHKSCNEYSTKLYGLAGHGSQPELGVSAVEYAVRYITKLFAIREELKAMVPNDSLFDPPYSTLQVGRIDGGSSFNVIADHCQIEWEMRTVQKSDFDYIRTEIDAYAENSLLPAMKAVFPESSIVREVVGEVEGLEVLKESAARELALKLTGTTETGLVAFGTEAGVFQKIGTSVVVCGPGSIRQAHKADEYLSIDQFNQCLTFLEKIVS